MPDDEQNRKINELEQEKKILESINRSLEDSSAKSESKKKAMYDQLEKLKHHSKEAEMTKKYLKIP